VAASAEPAPLDLRVNTIKSTRPQSTRGIDAPGAGAIRAGGICDTVFSRRHSPVQQAGVDSLAALSSGAIEVQDEGSQLIAHLVGATARRNGGRLLRGRGRQDAGARPLMRSTGRLTPSTRTPNA